MTTYENFNELDKLTLGKPTNYISEYSPKLLQAVPRTLNRDELNVKDNNLPFIGEDVWYGYELSWLNDKGKPIVAVAEFRFPCQSPAIVESKSFKLYLNSFNQTKFSSWQQVQEHLINDLSKTSGMVTQVTLYPVNACPPLTISDSPAICLDELDVTIDNYKLSPNILEQSNSIKDKKVTESLVSHLLKSNCLITNQPDWASIYISYTGKAIDHVSLLKYLISFRQHNEFHEQCVERIFCDIKKYCDISELTVFARYTRRGGLDINPFRSTLIKQAPCSRTLRQ
ncbi:MAG: 7-cyano-7-deazaguanine reductase [Alteromonadaceae bacterium]|jgi:7-cyano-7-deazaguanine reductase